MYEKLFAQSGLSLDRLRTFAEIVAAGGITAAAGDDSNRQSQYSRQLKELERYFGVELLKRGRGPMKLTVPGEGLYRVTRHALGGLEEFRQRCADQPLELSIGAGESLIQWLLLPRLPGLAAQHPHLKLTLLNLRTDDIIKRLGDGSVDFGVVSRLDSRSALGTALLGRLDYGLFLPAGPPIAARKLKTPSAVLDNLPLALLSGSGGLRRGLEEEMQKRQFRLDIRLECSSYPQLAQALQTIKLAVIMPTLASSSLPVGSFRLIRLPFLDSLSRQVSLAWNPKLAEVRPAIAVYARVFTAAFRQVVERR